MSNQLSTKPKQDQQRDKEVATVKRKIKSLDKDLEAIDERIGELEIDGVLKRQPKIQIKRIQKVLTKEIEKIRREKTKLLAYPVITHTHYM